MAKEVSMVEVVKLTLCHSSVDYELMEAQKLEDQTFIYDEWPDAAARLKRLLDAAVPEAVVIVEKQLMPKDEYGQLEPDGDA